MTPEDRRAALELEYDRLKRRADQINAYLSGDPDAWASIKVILENAKHIGSIEMDKAVAEGRQVALAMATVLKTLTAITETKPEAPTADPLQKMEDELAERRAQKGA